MCAVTRENRVVELYIIIMFELFLPEFEQILPVVVFVLIGCFTFIAIQAHNPTSIVSILNLEVEMENCSIVQLSQFEI